MATNNFTRPYFQAGFTGWFRGLFGGEVILSHPGTVSASWATASVGSKFVTASVEGDFKSGSVIGSVKFLVPKE